MYTDALKRKKKRLKKDSLASFTQGAQRELVEQEQLRLGSNRHSLPFHPRNPDYDAPQLMYRGVLLSDLLRHG
jgi:hypothetical protein